MLTRVSSNPKFIRVVFAMSETIISGYDVADAPTGKSDVLTGYGLPLGLPHCLIQLQWRILVPMFVDLMTVNVFVFVVWLDLDQWLPKTFASCRV